MLSERAGRRIRGDRMTQLTMTDPYRTPAQRTGSVPARGRSCDDDDGHLLRCFLVDASPAYRSGLSAALRVSTGLSVLELTDPGRLPVDVEQQSRSVAVIGLADLVEPPPDRAVRGRYAATVALLAHDDAGDFAAALRSGWSGVVGRNAPVRDIVQVVLHSAGASVLLPRDVARELSHGVQQPAWPRLRSEQVDWLRFLAGGGTVHGLAQHCAYSEREMHRRLRQCYLQLEVTGRTGALLAASRLGLL